MKRSKVNPPELAFLAYLKKDLNKRLRELPKYEKEMGKARMEWDIKKTTEWLECVEWARKIYVYVYSKKLK